MNYRHHLLWTAIVSSTVPASLAYSDDFGFEDPAAIEEEAVSARSGPNSIELGLGNVSDDNGKFGEFSRNMADQGAFLVGGVYLSGSNFILDVNRSAYNTSGALSYSSPGVFSASIYGYDNQKTEMHGAFVPKHYDLDLADLGNYTGRDFEVKRSSLGVEMTRYLLQSWLVNLDFSRELKEGNKTIAGPDHGPVVGRSVDFEHDQLSLSTEYWKDALSLGLSYYFSDFSDKDSEFSWNNSAFEGTIAAEPDNEFSRFELDGSYKFDQKTAVNWITSWSEAKQNDNFIDSDPGLPDSLDGEVERFFGRLTLTSRPLKNFNYKLEYAARRRDANHDTWDLDYRRNNSIYSKDKDSLKIEGGYRLPDRSKIRLGWKREEIERTREDVTDKWVDQTDEDIWWLDYRFAPIGKLNLTASYETGEREGNQGQNPDWIAVYNTDRDLDRVKINASLPLGNQVLLSGGYSWSDENFDNGDTWVPAQTPEETFGLDSREMSTANIDLTYSPSRDLSLSLYSVLQRFEWEQFGHKNYSGRPPREDDKWTATGEDKTLVVGMNMRWQARHDISILADLGVSESEGDLASSGLYTALNNDGSPVDISAVGVAYYESLPTYGSDSIRLNIIGNWQYRPDISTYIHYIFEKWKTEDYWWDGELQEEMYFAWRAPNETEHAVIVGIKKSF